ncbi:MAG: LCP family protein [Oscillospiraceae bacterium]|jgi:LCP family protein required for cell wall assembly|nr:LCP family protein [Oscillospiraceae bacterium]
MKKSHYFKSMPKKKFIISVVIPLGLVICILAMLILIANTYLDKIDIRGDEDESIVSIPDDLSGMSDADRARLEQQIRENIENNTQPLMFNKDVTNILFIGTDIRSQSEGRGRSDSMILISINKKTSKIIATSFLRDIYLQIPGVSQGDRLNSAYAYGGAPLLFKTLEQNFKIQVDKYVSVNFFSFINIIDIIGGIELDLTSAEVRVANDYIKEINGLTGKPAGDGLLTASGKQTVSGKQALGYARNRYIGNGDFSRTDRQRVVLEKIFDKVKTMGIIELNSLLNSILPEVTTNLQKGELFSMILSAPSYLKYSLESWHVPVEGSFEYLTVHGMSVIEVDFSANIAELQERIYGEVS